MNKRYAKPDREGPMKDFVYSPVRPTFGQLAAKYHKSMGDGYSRSNLSWRANAHDWWGKRERAQAAQEARRDMIVAKTIVEEEPEIRNRMQQVARQVQEMGLTFLAEHPIEDASVAVRLVDIGTKLELALLQGGAEKADNLPEPWKEFWKQHAKKGNGECASEVPS